MNLRPALETDVIAMVELARRAWFGAFSDHAPAIFVREWTTRDFESDWYPQHWRSMTVAEVGGQVVGLVQPMMDEINGLWVDPAYQSLGAGTALLRHGERLIAESGHVRVWLSCSAFNPNGCGFYEARGYRRFRSELKPRAEGVIEKLVYFERFLKAP